MPHKSNTETHADRSVVVPQMLGLHSFYQLPSSHPSPMPLSPCPISSALAMLSPYLLRPLLCSSHLHTSPAHVCHPLALSFVPPALNFWVYLMICNSPQPHSSPVSFHFSLSFICAADCSKNMSSLSVLIILLHPIYFFSVICICRMLLCF